MKILFKKKGLCFLLIFWGSITFASAQNYSAGNTLPGKEVMASEATAKKIAPNLKQVIIVYKTHFDIGYSETVQQVVHDYRTSMADKALDAIEKNKSRSKDNQFAWTVSSWPLKQILWNGQAPERKQKLEAAFRQGNLKMHALPFSMHTESADPEDLVRGLNIGSTLARKYQLALPISAKMSDVPGQSWIIPTLLTKAGVKFYHMGGPVVNKAFGLPDLFWWQGPDGSKLLTLYNNGYGSSALPPLSWPFKTWLFISMTGDNQGPPSPETVAQDIAFFEKQGIKAIVGSMDDFANQILKEDLSKLPVVRSDIGDPWIHGTMSMPEATKLAQNIRPSIGGLDKLNTLEKIWGIYRPDMHEAIADAYENSLLYSEHTWGMANQHYVKVPYGDDWKKQWANGLPPQYQLLESSWKDHAAYIEKVKTLVDNPYKDAIASLADNVKIDANHITVYNPLAWPRSGEIYFDTRLLLGNRFTSLKSADGKESVVVTHEYNAIEDAQPYSRFYVQDIPAMGYKTFVASNDEIKGPSFSFNAQQGIIESPFFKATIDSAKGSIVSLVDKRTGKELVDANAPHGLGEYFYERYCYNQLNEWLGRSLYPQYVAHKFSFVAYDMPKQELYQSSAPKNMKISIVQSAIDIKAILTGTMEIGGQSQQVSMSLTLSGFEPTADIELSWQKQPDSWPEAGWLCLPFKINNQTFELGRLGGNVNPAKDMNVTNANYRMWWVNTGAAIYDSVTGSGIGICSPDAPMLSVGEPGEYKFDSTFSTRKPYIYLNLYNNHWRTNFPAWIGHGQRMSAKVRVWSFDKYNTESSLFTPAMETRVPLLAAGSKLRTGNLPTAEVGISLSRKGVSVTAFGANPDGNGTILRLWEQAGASGKITVQLPKDARFKSARLVDLRGQTNGSTLAVNQGKVIVDLPAYAPVSLVLE
jgi:hypothetical protein